MEGEGVGSGFEQVRVWVMVVMKKVLKKCRRMQGRKADDPCRGSHRNLLDTYNCHVWTLQRLHLCMHTSDGLRLLHAMQQRVQVLGSVGALLNTQNPANSSP